MKALWGILGILMALPVFGQEAIISRFQPGNYLADDQHLIEITQSGRNQINLDGYLLVTRDYSVRLPAGAIASAGQPYRIGKRSSANQLLDLQLSETPDFLIRFHLLENEGNYVALIDREGKVVDAFYYSPQPNVPFLPERDTLITFDRRRLPFYLPPENRSVWSYLSARDDPANNFIKSRGKWTQANASSLTAPTNHADLTLRYFDGIVTIKWATAYENGLDRHLVERSEDQETFEVVGEVKAIGESQEFQYYVYYDKEILIGENYFYRIRSVSKEEEVFSKMASVRIEEGQAEFSMELILAPHSDGTELNLRFTSAYSQDVRIKLLDERMAEVAILFQDYVNARQPNLLKVSRRLPPGRYLILASTEARRFGREFVIE